MWRRCVYSCCCCLGCAVVYSKEQTEETRNKIKSTAIKGHSIFFCFCLVFLRCMNSCHCFSVPVFAWCFCGVCTAAIAFGSNEFGQLGRGPSVLSLSHFNPQAMQIDRSIPQLQGQVNRSLIIDNHVYPLSRF